MWCACTCMFCMCGGLCACAYKWDNPKLMPGIIFDCSFIGAGSLNQGQSLLQLVWLAGLLWGVTAGHHTHPALVWVLGTQTPVLTLVQQTLYHLCHFPSPNPLKSETIANSSMKQTLNTRCHPGHWIGLANLTLSTTPQGKKHYFTDGASSDMERLIMFWSSHRVKDGRTEIQAQSLSIKFAL